MPDLEAKLHLGGARLDSTPARDDAAAAAVLPGAAALAPAFGARQVRPEIAAVGCVRVDVLVDRLLADVRTPFQTRTSANDIGRPSLPELPLGILADGFGEAPGPGPLRPFLGKRLRLLGTVPSFARVSLQFAADRAWIAAEPPGDLVVADSCLPPLVD